MQGKHAPGRDGLNQAGEQPFYAAWHMDLFIAH